MSRALVESFKVLTTLAAYRIVDFHTAGVNTVVYLPTSTNQPIGVTLDSVRETTGAIPVAIGGIAKVLFNDSVSAGGLVAADSSGRGIPCVPFSAGAGYIGKSVRFVNVTGTISDVIIQPGIAYEVP